LSSFCFSLSSFQVPELDHHHMSTPPAWTSFHVAISINECHLAPSLRLDQPISNLHLEHRVSPNRFHQLAKTKQELSHVQRRHDLPALPPYAFIHPSASLLSRVRASPCTTWWSAATWSCPAPRPL
jgi:hypothetical protein